MAKSTLLFILGLVLGVVAGCSTSRRATDNVPPPSFNAPTVMRPAPPVLPNYVPKKPVVPASPPKVAAVRPSGPKEWSPHAPTRPWRYIVIHHSDTSGGSAARFDQFHKDKGWDELGYHFVIGNGSESRDGQVEIGPRWSKQKWGAHTKTPDNRYNDYGIGICLVGDFQNGRPTADQLKSLSKLTAHLMKTYQITANNIIGHGDAKPTECPGRNLSVATVRRMANQLLADSDRPPDPSPIAAGKQMLRDLPK